MSGKNKKQVIIGSLCAAILFMVVGYTAFSNILNIKGTTNISSNWDVKITNVESRNIVGNASNNGNPVWDGLTATFKAHLVSPGDSITYDITVTNLGSVNAQLDKITLSDTENPAIRFESSGLIEGDILQAGATSVLIVKVSYDNSITSDPGNKIGNLTATLEYSQATSVKRTNTLMTINDLKTLTVTNEAGLYADKTETGRYVYRGANPDNYISFNGENWRIISIEADNTLKIIKSESLNNMPAYSISSGTPIQTNIAPFDFAYISNMPSMGKIYNNIDNTRYSMINTDYCGYASDENSYAGCNVWGSQNTMLDANGQNITQMAQIIGSGLTYNLPADEAYLNKYLNEIYYMSLSDEAKGQITEHSFNVGVQGASSKQTIAEDVVNAKTNTWKGKIGLIQATDFIKSSLDSNCTNVYTGSVNNTNHPCKNDNYLTNVTSYWTLSPVSGSEAGTWSVDNGGYLTYNNKDYNSVLPVVYVKSNIILTGSGTILDPYIIN